MYCTHYGFSERPFEPTPDPKFLYLSPIHREVQSSLLYGIRERRGFIVVLGEAGTGKTTLLRSVLEQLEEDVRVAIINNTDVTFDEFLHMVLVDLGLADESERLGKVAALQRLNELAIGQLHERGNVVIMVDEAQNLDRSCLENLRLLSNLETSKNKLLQIVLSGQPELEDKLRRADLRQLLQRVNLRRHLLPFDEKDTAAYIRHRLSAAHCKGPALFKGGALRLIWNYSGGIPRKINTVCDNALLTGYALKRRRIDEGMVREVIDDLTRTPYNRRRASSPGTFPVASPQPLVKPARRRTRSLRLLIPVAGLSLLVAIGLGIWWHYWNEKNTAALPDQIQTTATEVQSPPADMAVSLPPPTSAADEVSSPGAGLVTAAKANPSPLPPSLPETVKDETAPQPVREANLTPTEEREQDTKRVSSPSAVLIIEAEANRPPHLQPQIGTTQSETAPQPTRETNLAQPEAEEQDGALKEARKPGELNPVLNAIKGMFPK